MYERGEKEDHLDTIRYEIDMLDFAYRALAVKGDGGERGEFNAYLECFLLHYRNLIEFFSAKNPRNDGTDLRVGVARVWARPGVDRSGLPGLVRGDLYDKYWNDLSRYLDHCTTYRAEFSKRWDTGQMYEELNPTLEEFVGAAHLARVVPGGVKLAGPASLLGESTSTHSGPGPSVLVPPVKGC